MKYNNFILSIIAYQKTFIQESTLKTLFPIAPMTSLTLTATQMSRILANYSFLIAINFL